MDALVAYLQMIGTLVDFSVYEADDLEQPTIGDPTMYEILSSFAQTGGLVYFVVMFTCALAYALVAIKQRNV